MLHRFSCLCRWFEVFSIRSECDMVAPSALQHTYRAKQAGQSREDFYDFTFHARIAFGRRIYAGRGQRSDGTGRSAGSSHR
ncbi:hypothetical protein GCM10011367_06550 [Marinicauda pacifica]|nr:hypothetical protein GCM10011367_06550 [Marinicauda pacifica]